MRIVNGVKVFDTGIHEAKDHLPHGLPVPDYPGLYVPFGLRGVEIGGQWCWTPASVDDYLACVAQLQAVSKKEVSLSKRPPCSGPGGCNGSCGSGMCYPVLIPNEEGPPYWGCNCA